MVLCCHMTHNCRPLQPTHTTNHEHLGAKFFWSKCMSDCPVSIKIGTQTLVIFVMWAWWKMSIAHESLPYKNHGIHTKSPKSNHLWGVLNDSYFAHFAAWALCEHLMPLMKKYFFVHFQVFFEADRNKSLSLVQRSVEYSQNWPLFHLEPNQDKKVPLEERVFCWYLCSLCQSPEAVNYQGVTFGDSG